MCDGKHLWGIFFVDDILRSKWICLSFRLSMKEFKCKYMDFEKYGINIASILVTVKDKLT